ncbi:MAG: hypothetical protein GWN29_08595 [Gammaproteobacteria bacterium]|nr:hypothetical protein [Gammaproteobacteria bacterium]
MRARQVAASISLVVSIAMISLPKTLAHHGDAGRFEETITTLSGTVVALQLINPHSMIIMDVMDEASGQSVRWQVEVSNANSLSRIGWTRDTLKPGDPITVSGRVLKSGAPYINLTERARLTRTDTCEELFYTGMIWGEVPDYPAPTCD